MLLGFTIRNYLVTVKVRPLVIFGPGSKINESHEDRRMPNSGIMQASSCSISY